jgi:hypothetical protein
MRPAFDSPRLTVRRPARQELLVGELRIDGPHGQVTLRGRPIACSPLEFELLYTLAERAGTASVRGAAGRVWGEGYPETWRGGGSDPPTAAPAAGRSKRTAASRHGPRRRVYARGPAPVPVQRFQDGRGCRALGLLKSPTSIVKRRGQRELGSGSLDRGYFDAVLQA